MKRWPIILLISLAVIVFLSPGIVGHLAEKNLAENLSWIESGNDDIAITVEQFDRGWFSSEGRHRVTLQNGSLLELLASSENLNGSGMPGLIIDTRLDHGLVPLTSLGREQGSLLPGIASSVSTLKIDNGGGEIIDLPGTIYSTIGLTGNSTFHYQMDAGSQADENALITWSGADIIVNSTPASRSFRVEGSIEPTSIESYGVITDVGPVSFDVSQDRSQYAFGIGAVKLEIDSLSVTTPGELLAGFGKVSLDAASKLNGNRVNASSTLLFTRVIVPGIGPMNVDIDFAANGLDARSLDVLLSALRDAQSNALTGSNQAALSPQVQEDLEKLVAKGLDFQFGRFNVSVPQGDLSASMTIAVAELDDGKTFHWPGALLATTASADLAVSRSLYEMVREMNPEINTLVAMGMLKPSGDQYEMAIRYAQGLLTINGAPMPIPLGLPQ